MSIPEGGVCCGWQTILRSKSIYGPYERKVVLEQGTTDINGPHQGAIVDTPDGSWWFFHFQEWSPLGRIVHLQPVRWEDGWPLMGVDADGNGIGEPVAGWKMPLGNSSKRKTGDVVWKDDFGSTVLKPEWQWNHNPNDEAWSLTENPGQMTFHAQQSPAFMLARNTLTLRTLGYHGTASVMLDFSQAADGMRCGLGCMGKKNHLIGVKKENGKAWLYVEDNFQEETSIALKENKVYLRLQLDATNNVYRFEYSTDGRHYRQLGKGFYMRWGNWKGARVALYAYNNIAAQGTAIFDDFVYAVKR
jgi:beta-xylosidase